jgi:hypothetical protein
MRLIRFAIPPFKIVPARADLLCLLDILCGVEGRAPSDLIFPAALVRKRFLTPLCVFILGMIIHFLF